MCSEIILLKVLQNLQGANEFKIHAKAKGYVILAAMLVHIYRHPIIWLWFFLWFVCCVYNNCAEWICKIILPTFLRVASLALGQIYNFPGASEATLKDMDPTGQYQNKAYHRLYT